MSTRQFWIEGRTFADPVEAFSSPNPDDRGYCEHCEDTENVSLVCDAVRFTVFSVHCLACCDQSCTTHTRSHR